MQDARGTRDRVFGFVVGYYAAEGVAPTVRQVMAGAGLKSPSHAHYVLRALVAEGRLLYTSRGFIPARRAA